MLAAQSAVGVRAHHGLKAPPRRQAPDQRIERWQQRRPEQQVACRAAAKADQHRCPGHAEQHQKTPYPERTPLPVSKPLFCPALHARITGGTATLLTHSRRTSEAVIEDIPASSDSTRRCVSTDGATACTSWGVAKSRPSSSAQARAQRARAIAARGLAPSVRERFDRVAAIILTIYFL